MTWQSPTPTSQRLIESLEIIANRWNDSKYQAALKTQEDVIEVIGNEHFRSRRLKSMALRRMGSQQELTADFDGALNNYDRAIHECKAMLALQPYNHYSWHELRQVHRQRGALLYSLERLNEANDDFQSHLEADGNHWEVQSYLARLHLWGPDSIRDPDKALAIAAELVDSQPNKVLFNFLKAAALLELGEYERALEVSKVVSDLANEKQAESFVSSIAFAMLGELDNAKSAFAAGNEFLLRADEPTLIPLKDFEINYLKEQAEGIINR